MQRAILKLFDDEVICQRIQSQLPKMFDMAEAMVSRGGKLGMEIGTLREQILIALLLYVYGEEHVDISPLISESEVDVILYGEPVSIKTGLSKSVRGIPNLKAIWTVDARKAREFVENYSPQIDILLAIVRWNHEGGLYIIPTEVQARAFGVLGRDKYLRPPKAGTNPRGVEFTKEAIKRWLEDRNTKSLPIHWQRPQYSAQERTMIPYRQWLELWRQSE